MERDRLLLALSVATLVIACLSFLVTLVVLRRVDQRVGEIGKRVDGIEADPHIRNLLFLRKIGKRPTNGSQ